MRTPAGPTFTANAAFAADLGSGSGPAAGSAVHAAWLEYRAVIARHWDVVLACDFAEDPHVRAQGLYYLQSMEATAHHCYIAPRHQYPALYVHSLYMPMAELSWGDPNPDFMYHDGWLDGAHTYRIWGNRRGSHWATLQVLRGFWGDEARGDLNHVDFDDVPTDANGDFELFLGPNPPADPGGKYWVKLDPELHNIMLILRETFYDWDNNVPMQLHIDILDRIPNAPIHFDEAELTARFVRARTFLDYNLEFTMSRLRMFAREPEPGVEVRTRNKLYMSHDGNKHGGNPIAVYAELLYDIAADEALIVEMPLVQARYWGVQLENIWRQTTDYTYHSSSLNGVQAHADADGRVRIVLSQADPGTPNWLDPAGIPVGAMIFRWFKVTDYEGPPTVTKVKLSEVRGRLPAETPSVTPEARKAKLDARTAAARRRWGQ